MTKKKIIRIFRRENGNFFLKSPRNFFASPQTRRQVSAHVYTLRRSLGPAVYSPYSVVMDVGILELASLDESDYRAAAKNRGSKDKRFRVSCFFWYLL